MPLRVERAAFIPSSVDGHAGVYPLGYMTGAATSTCAESTRVFVYVWTPVFQTPTSCWAATRPSSARSRRASVARAMRVPTTITAGTGGGTPGGSSTGEPHDRRPLGLGLLPPSGPELRAQLFL